jgi:hypothetical protein
MTQCVPRSLTLSNEVELSTGYKLRNRMIVLVIRRVRGQFEIPNFGNRAVTDDDFGPFSWFATKSNAQSVFL